MKNKKKLIITITMIVTILVITLGITYAAFMYRNSSINGQILLGSIYMKYEESKGLSASGLTPGEGKDIETSDSYYEFTISGKNTYKQNDIWYDIKILYGDKHDTRPTRINDNFLRFTLVETVNNQDTIIFSNKSYETINNRIIHVGIIPKNSTTEINKTYRLYVWLDEDIKIGGEDGDYTTEEWSEDLYASFKVEVTGDFNEKTVTEDIPVKTTLTGIIGETFTLNANETKEIEVNITTDVKREINYEMYYVENPETGVIIKSTEDFQNNIVAGTMTETKTIKLTFINTGSEETEIRLGAKAGLTPEEVVIPSGTKNIILEKNAPVITTTLESTTEPVNGWYKEVTIKGSATDQESEVVSISSCITTTSCTPNEEVNGETKSVTISTSNTEGQKVCFQAIDLAGNQSEITCSNLYKIDNISPTVTNLEDAGDGKITFTTNDTHSGPSKYCVNQHATDTTNCTWYDAVSGTQTTGEIVTSDGDYYVHVKDEASNIGHSEKVTMSLIPPATELIKSKLGTGGLVAVNTSGTLYNGTGTIREYRYSGPTANNYVFFDTNGDGVKTNNEVWRIVGVFKDNQEGEERVRIMRNTILTSAELPASYVVNGKTYAIENGTTGEAYWNDIKTTNYNDWTTAGLQYYLNTVQDQSSTPNPGYLSFLTSEAEAVIAENTYHLGNVYVEGDTAISAYTDERGTTICASSVTSNSHNSNCNIWNGNQATWTGKVGLLYPSDYGYSATNTYWSTILYAYDEVMDTSWMYKTANYTTNEWFVSPSSVNPGRAMYWNLTGFVDYNLTDYDIALRPVLNLISGATITDAAGTLADPYVVVIE